MINSVSDKQFLKNILLFQLYHKTCLLSICRKIHIVLSIILTYRKIFCNTQRKFF